MTDLLKNRKFEVSIVAREHMMEIFLANLSAFRKMCVHLPDDERHQMGIELIDMLTQYCQMADEGAVEQRQMHEASQQMLSRVLGRGMEEDEEEEKETH